MSMCMGTNFGYRMGTGTGMGFNTTGYWNWYPDTGTGTKVDTGTRMETWDENGYGYRNGDL